MKSTCNPRIVNVLPYVCIVHMCVHAATHTEQEDIYKIAQLIYTYIDHRQESSTNEILHGLAHIFNDKTLATPACHIVKESLVPMLANKIFSVSLMDNKNFRTPSHQQPQKRFKFLYFDGTSAIVEECKLTKQKIVVQAKPESPWHLLSLAELIKRFRLINHIHKIGFSYPFSG